MSECMPSTFTSPVIPGADIVAIRTSLVMNYSREVTPVYYPNHGSFNVDNASFCNVTVSYVHQQDDDLVTVEAWLPDSGWNGRLQADGGILNALGEPDHMAIRHWGSDTLNGMAIIAKSAIRDFYALAMFWPQMLMNIMGEHPRGCELDILTALTVQESMVISRGAAIISHASWAGPTDVVGNFLWYGINRGMDLSSDVTDGICESNPNPEYNYSAITWEEFGEIMRKSGAEYDSVVASSNPDLTESYEAGGKMLTYHGPYDQVIPIRAMEDCYDSMRDFVPNPTTVFDAMRAWIENGTAPESLPTIFIDVYKRTNNRVICPYPERAVLKEDCGRTTDSACFVLCR
ncbi:Tannase/feruloyl esterase [Biscogniauxia mediterranea]|nr:Tannase/feruloyl esterase [Biscogniauxia mediterranea]